MSTSLDLAAPAPAAPAVADDGVWLACIACGETFAPFETIATAIRIGNPVNAPKALPGIRETGGTATAVTDEQITRAQRDLAEAGIGVEPASATTLAGIRKLRAEGVIGTDEQVVALTTGHLLKDPEAAAAAGSDPEPVPGTFEGVLSHLSG